MHEFKIEKNTYLSKKTKGFYHTKYTTQGTEGNPDYLNHFKNTYGKPEATDAEWFKTQELNKLNAAVAALSTVLTEDLPQIFEKLKLDSIYVCVVPRSKLESTYNSNQLLFKSTVISIIESLDNFENASSYLIRNANTKTTHLPDNTPDYTNDGNMPYIGITNDTCTLSEDIKGKDILLIDDIYTAGINIDEDAIQSLLTKGANSVTFYAVGACGI